MKIDHLERWIGRVMVTRERVAPEAVARFNATFDHSSGLEDGCAVPPLFHFCIGLNTSPTSELGEDGHPARGGFLPPVPLPRRMWAGGYINFVHDIRVGDLVERCSRISDIRIKQGKSGQLCFVTVEHLMSSDSRVLVKELQDIVYRDAEQFRPAEASELAQSDVPAIPIGAHLRSIIPSPTQLFRYSAITFNAHRVHYDRSYCAAVESYPGLVVHGPLQATLLALFAAELGGRTPKSFSFRSNSPLFDTSEFNIHASEEGTSLRLWTARAGGPIAMEASAQWGC